MNNDVQRAMADDHADPVSVGRIVSRVDRLPTLGLGRGFFALLSLSYLFAFYDLTSIGVNLSPMLADLHIARAASGPPVTWGLVAYMVGAYLFGSVADLAGRRVALRLSILVLAVGSLLTACSWDLLSLTLFRVVTGIGIGAQISLAATIAGEFASSATRGRLVSVNALGGAVGLVVTPLVGLALLRYAHLGWRLVFAAGALSALLLVLCTDRWMPESPRWLAVHGRLAEAERVVGRMEQGARRRGGAELPDPAPAQVNTVTPVFPTAALFTGRLAPRLALVMLFWLLWYLWIYGMLGYGPTLLSAMGLSVPQGLAASAVGYLGFLAGGLVAPLLIDRVERKLIVVAGALVAAVGFALMATATPGTAVFGILVVGFGNFVAVSSAYTYTAETFPTGARATAMALGDGVGHLGGAAAPLLVLPLLAGAGPRATFWALAAVAALSALVISAGLRTTRRSLTELSETGS